MLEGARVILGLREAHRVRQEMTANRYAESLGVGDCLRAESLRYLGAEKPPTRADECCSLCDVNLAVPWADEPAWEDLTDPGRYQDAKYTVLKAVAWDAGLADVRGRAPYGSRTLAHILLGNGYAVTRYETDPARAASAHHVQRALWGAGGPTRRCRHRAGPPGRAAGGGVRGRSGAALERGHVHPPHADGPTARGLQRLAEGRLFVGEVRADG